VWLLYVLLLLSIVLLPLFLYLRRPAGRRLIDRIASARFLDGFGNLTPKSN